MEPGDVAASTTDQVDVLRILADSYRGAIPAPGQKGFYYALTLAGFNYIDEVCDVYIEELFKMDRRKNRMRDILTLATSTSTAVLTAADVTKDTMLYVAQALGFTSGVIGITADSYLYRVGPTKVHGIVRRLQSTYRDELAKKTTRIVSAPLVVYELRSYLSLCFPVTIESKIDEMLAESKAAATTKNQATIQLKLTTAPAAR